MNYRFAEIMAPEDLGPSGTKTIELTLTDVVSRLVIRFCPVGGSNTPSAHPVKDIKKIELIDGSDVLYSLTGYEGQALNIFEARKPVTQYIDARTGGTPLTYVNMDFGRILYDRELAFDPKKFGNPQLKITWDETLHDSGCTSHDFSVFGHVFDEKPVSPIGFLMNKEIKSYTPNVGTNEYTEVPTDYPIRKLILQGLKYGAGVRGLIETIRLSENNDKKVPIDGDIWYLRALLDEMAGEAEDYITANVPTAGTPFYCTPSDLFSAVAIGDTAARVILVANAIGGRFAMAAETGTTGVIAHLKGKNPHGCIAIPFGRQDDMDDWYDVTALKSLRLRIKGGTSSVSTDLVNVVTQQIRRY